MRTQARTRTDASARPIARRGEAVFQLLLRRRQIDAAARRIVHALARALGEFLFAADVPVTERSDMRPLARRGMRGFRSPLNETPMTRHAHARNC